MGNQAQENEGADKVPGEVGRGCRIPDTGYWILDAVITCQRYVVVRQQR